ncbi:uncharacterized protein [Ptychodera flava]|uniref:uncharacterized protein isoform X2 n=1 Tax=Ptychodera flava TaxID=63121 RepID=UPI00396A4700
MADVFQVQGWILDYACKHRMDKVIHLLSKYIPNEFTDFNVPQVRLLAASAWSILKTENVEYFDKLVEHLMYLYEAGPGVSTFRHFTKMIVGLKMKALLHVLSENYDYTVALAKLNAYFPKSGIKIKCAPENKKEMAKLNQQQKKFRQFIMKLLMNDRDRKNYLAEEMKTEYGPAFMQSLQHLVRSYLERMERYLPKTAVEQFLSRDPDSSISTEATSSQSSAVRKLVTLLDSGPPSQEALVDLLQEIVKSDNSSRYNLESGTSDSGEDSIQLGDGSNNVFRRSKRLANNCQQNKEVASKGNDSKSSSKCRSTPNKTSMLGTEPLIIPVDISKRTCVAKSKPLEFQQTRKAYGKDFECQSGHSAEVSSMTLRSKSSDSSESERLLANMKRTRRVEHVPGVQNLSSSSEMFASSSEGVTESDNKHEEQRIEKSKQEHEKISSHNNTFLPSQAEQTISEKDIVAIPESPVSDEVSLNKCLDSDEEVIFNIKENSHLTSSQTSEHFIRNSDEAFLSSQSGKEADIESLSESEIGSESAPRRKRKRLSATNEPTRKSRRIMECKEDQESVDARESADPLDNTRVGSHQSEHVISTSSSPAEAVQVESQSAVSHLDGKNECEMNESLEKETEDNSSPENDHLLNDVTASTVKGAAMRDIQEPMEEEAMDTHETDISNDETMFVPLEEPEIYARLPLDQTDSENSSLVEILPQKPSQEKEDLSVKDNMQSQRRDFDRTKTQVATSSKSRVGLPWLDLLPCHDSEEDFQPMHGRRSTASKSTVEKTNSSVSTKAMKERHAYQGDGNTRHVTKENSGMTLVVNQVQGLSDELNTESPSSNDANLSSLHCVAKISVVGESNDLHNDSQEHVVSERKSSQDVGSNFTSPPQDMQQDKLPVMETPGILPFPKVLPHLNMCSMPSQEERYCENSDSSLNFSPQHHSQDFYEYRDEWVGAKNKMQSQNEKGKSESKLDQARTSHKPTDTEQKCQFTTASKRGLWCKNLQREEVDMAVAFSSNSNPPAEQTNLHTTSSQDLCSDGGVSTERQTNETCVSSQNEDVNAGNKTYQLSPRLASTAETLGEDAAAEPCTPNRFRASLSPKLHLRTLDSSSILDSSSPFRTPPESPTELPMVAVDDEIKGINDRKDKQSLIPLQEGQFRSQLSPKLQSPKSPKKSPRCNSLLFDFYKKKAAESSVKKHLDRQGIPYADSEPLSKKSLLMSALSAEPQKDTKRVDNDMLSLVQDSSICTLEKETTDQTSYIRTKEAVGDVQAMLPSPNQKQSIPVIQPVAANTESSKASLCPTSASHPKAVDPGKSVDLNSNKNIKKVHFMNCVRLCKMSTKARENVEKIRYRNSLKRQLRETTEKKRNSWNYLNLKLVARLHITRIPKDALTGNVPVKNGDGLVYVSKRSAEAFSKGYTLRLFPDEVKQTKKKKKEESITDSAKDASKNSHFRQMLLPSSPSSLPLSSSYTNSQVRVLLTNLHSHQGQVSELLQASSPGRNSSVSRQFGQGVDGIRKLPFTESVTSYMPANLSTSSMNALSVRLDHDYSFVIPESVTPQHSPTSINIVESPMSHYSPEAASIGLSRRLASIPSMTEHLEGSLTRPCLVKVNKLSTEDVVRLATPVKARRNLEQRL